MPLADLLETFERDTDAEVRAIADAAAAEVARIERDAARERANRVAQASSETTRELQAVADRQLAEAARQARTTTLAARAAMLDSIRAAVDTELPRLLADPELGRRLVRAAVACVGDGTGELRCAPELVATARAEAPELRVVGDPAVTGAVIELTSGVRIDATLATLLDREWPRLACEALVLAGER